MPLERVRDDGPGLGQVRRAGDVADDAAGPYRGRSPCRAAAVAAGPDPTGPRAGAASAPLAGGAARRARSTARRAAPGRRRRRARRGRARRRRRRARCGASASARPTSRARCGATSLAMSTAPRSAASPASSPALPPGPAARSSQTSSRPSSGAVGQGERGELTAFVLYGGPAAPDGRDRGRLAATRQPYRVRGHQAGHGLRASGLEQLVAGDPAGSRDQVDLRPVVVGVEGRLGLGEVADRASAKAPTIHRGCEVVKVSRPTSSPGASSASHSSRLRRLTARMTALANLERPSPAWRRTRSTVEDTAACCGTRVCSSWYGAQAQGVADLRVDLAERPARAGGEDHVELAGHAQRAVGQLGGQRRVAAVDLAVAQQGGQHQVGVRVLLVDRAQGREGRVAGRVDGRPRPARATWRTGGSWCVVAQRNPSPGSGRTPRAQSPAGISALPSGRTVPSATGPVAVPTSTCRPSTRSSPGGSGSRGRQPYRTELEPLVAPGGPGAGRRRGSPDQPVDPYGRRRPVDP